MIFYNKLVMVYEINMKIEKIIKDGSEVDIINGKMILSSFFKTVNIAYRQKHYSKMFGIKSVFNLKLPDIKVSVLQDESHLQSNSGSVLTRAIGGDLLFGPAGAFLGAFSANKKGKLIKSAYASILVKKHNMKILVSSKDSKEVDLLLKRHHLDLM
jgi:hypothetical protein